MKPRGRTGWMSTLALLAVTAAPVAVTGQELARRVSAVGEGKVVLRFPARPEVEVCDQGLRIGEDRITWHSRGRYDGPGICDNGPIRVELTVREGRVRDLDVLRRQESPSREATDLGELQAEAAVEFFDGLARAGGSSGRGLEEAVLPMMLADVEEVWRKLLALAKDGGVDADVRSAALFWTSQEAAAVVTEGLAEVAMDEEEDQDVREAAVFALSQRPDVEGVPILMEVARTAEHAETREAAMFWLAQSGDERVVPFFEAILLGRGGGQVP